MNPFDILPPVISSLIFLALGSLVFHISSLISGFSIYRELSSHQSSLITVSVSAIVFILSPIGYIVFYPDQFIEYCETLNSHSVGCDPKREHGLDPVIWGMIYNIKSIGPFLSNIVGLGLIFGSFEKARFRILILERLRKFTGASFVISSYTNSWDNYLKSTKPRGEINVVLDNISAPETGRLISYSVKQEPREIVIETNGDGDKEKKRELILGCAIKRIEIPMHSLRRNKQLKSYLSTGFYLALSSIGFLLIALGSYFTGTYIDEDHSKLQNMMNNYFEWGLLMLFLSGVLSVLSESEGKREFKNGNAYLIFCRAVGVLNKGVLVLASLLFIIFLLRRGLFGYNSYIKDYGAMVILMAIVVSVIVCWFYANTEKSCRKCLNKLKEDTVRLSNSSHAVCEVIDCMCRDIDISEKDVLGAYSADNVKIGLRSKYSGNRDVIEFLDRFDSVVATEGCPLYQDNYNLAYFLYRKVCA